jgi:PAS domain S-box-containing protein
MMAAKKLDDAVDRTDVAVLLVGPDGIVSYANAAAHELLGYPNHGLEGLSLEWLSPPSRHAELRNVQAVLEGQNSRRIRSAVLRVDGSVVDVAVSLEPCINADGRVVAVSVRYDPLPPVRTSTMPSGYPSPTSGVRPALASQTPTASQAESPVQHGPDPVENVRTALQLLGWLQDRLLAPLSSAPLDDPRERARALLVLGEASAALTEHVRAFSESTDENGPRRAT